MGRKAVLFILFCVLANWALAQQLTLQEFNQQRLQRNKVSMMVLGGWAAGNMITSGILLGSSDDEDKYFHQMNIGWNAVNFGIATLGYLASKKADPGTFDLNASVKAQHSTEKVLLFNGGLDVGYMLGGLYLMERSKNTDNNPDRLKGYGRSVLIQGAFLFAFDLTTYFIHTRHKDDLSPFLSGLHIQGNQVGLVLNF